MKVIEIDSNEAGQRLDRFLLKYMNKASKSFVQKMIRKKRIKLNKSRAHPGDSLMVGDEVQLYLSDETIDKFTEKKIETAKKKVDILYEDDRILAINKPKNTLTHGEGNSIMNRALNYLIVSGSYIPEREISFKPAACNRLDRNTSGVVVIGKTYDGLKEVNYKIKHNEVRKYYLALVRGSVTVPKILNGYWKKEGKQVTVLKSYSEGFKPVVTKIRPIKGNRELTLLNVELVTGKTHQIRAHLKAIGHPIIGDPKYGDDRCNKSFRNEFSLNSQFLHAYKLVICDYNDGDDLCITAKLPKSLDKLLGKLKLTGISLDGGDSYGLLE